MRPVNIRNGFGEVRSTRESRTSGRNSSSGVDCGMIATARTHCRPFHPKRGCTDPRISGLLHLLRTLSRVGAHLADLYWRGRFVKRDERRALALIRVAVENAPEHERIWIEDIYQNIFCGASQGTRQQADGMVARWRKLFSHPSPAGERMGLGAELQPQRACGDGEILDIGRDVPGKEVAPTGTMPPASVQGSTTGFGFRETGKR